MKNKSKQAKFILSLDCELLWGSHYIGGEKRFKYLNNGVLHLYRELIKLMDTYRVKGTFAFVGALTLTQQEFLSEVEKLKVNITYEKWLSYLHLLSVNSERIDLWYNKKILEYLLLSNQKHELASHSFTHLSFDKIDNKNVAQTEFELSYLTLAKHCNKKIRTFIFPENKIFYRKEFKISPYEIYRGLDKVWYRGFPLQRLLHFLDQTLPLAPNVVNLEKDEEGNFYVSGSLMLLAYDGVRKIIPDWIRYMKIKRGVDRAIKEGKIFHLWFHPWNLGSSPRMLRVLERVFKYVEQCSNNGTLSVVTMGELVHMDHPRNG